MTLPHAIEILPAVRAARTAAGHLFVGLDFDGTLTPIVARPEDARLPAAAREPLSALAARSDTTLALLSGRALADVRARVPIDGACYAGNHGLEIDGPGIHEIHPGVAAARPALERVLAQLDDALTAVPGVVLEDKGASLSVHYRMVAPPDRDRVRATARRIAEPDGALRVTEGKMVVEVRPAVSWHKGEALRWLRRELPHAAGAPAIFIGDDRTDEDAFLALGEGGWGIVVGEAPPPDTAACCWLRSPVEVIDWLARLAQ